MNEFHRNSQDLTPGWGAVALIAGFLLGVPTALAFGPIVLSMLPGWLNELGKNVAFSLLAGLLAGTGAAFILTLTERWQKRR